MNSTLVSQALEKVPNAQVLINLVAQRVRQLNSYGGGASRPLVANVANLCATDIALREIIEGKMGFQMPEWVALTRPSGRNGKRPQHWGKVDHGKQPNARHPAPALQPLTAPVS